MSLNRRSFFRALAGAVCTVAGMVYGAPSDFLQGTSANAAGSSALRVTYTEYFAKQHEWGHADVRNLVPVGPDHPAVVPRLRTFDQEHARWPLGHWYYDPKTGDVTYVIDTTLEQRSEGNLRSSLEACRQHQEWISDKAKVARFSQDTQETLATFALIEM